MSCRYRPTSAACDPINWPMPSIEQEQGCSIVSRPTPILRGRCWRPIDEGVIAATAAAGAFLIEDDWARDFALEGDASPPLAPEDRDGDVVYVRFLTKCAAPGLRVGAICARGAAFERLRAARLVDDFFVPGILQETALQLVSTPSWPRHLRLLRAALRTRRDAMAAALRTHLGKDCLPTFPIGGLHLWCALPNGVSDIEVEQRASGRGILVSAGRHWYPAEPAGSFLRLSFAAAQPDWIDECIKELTGIIRGVGEQWHGRLP